MNNVTLYWIQGHLGIEGYAAVQSVAFSHDLARLESASYDRTIKLWDASRSDYLQTLHTGKPLNNISLAYIFILKWVLSTFQSPNFKALL